MKELSQLNKHMIYSYVPRVANLLIVPIQVAILTKSMSIEEYGVLSLLQSSFMMLTFVFTLGLQKYISIKIPGKDIDIQYKYFKSLFILELSLYSIFSLFLFMFLKPILSYLGILNFIEVTKLFLIIYFFSLLYNEFGRFLNYRKMIGTRVLLGVLEKIIELIFIIVVIKILNKNDIYHIALAYLTLYIMMSTIYAVISIDYSKFIHTRLEKKIFKNAIIFSLPLIISDISWRLMQNVDFYFLSGMHMQVDLGIYAFITKLLNYIYLAGSPIIWVIYPYITAAFNQKKRIDKKVYFFIQKQYKYSFLFLTFSMGVLLTNLDFFVLQLAKQEFLVVKDAYFLYAIYPVLLSIMYIQQQILLLKHKTKYIGIIYLIGLCINIILDYYFINLMGVYGVIIATIVAILFVIFMQERESALIKLRIVIFPFLILFLIYFAQVYIQNYFFLNSFFIFSFITLVYFLKIINKKDIQMIISKIRRK